MNDKTNVPLSQAPGKKKVLVGLPVVVVSGFLWAKGIEVFMAPTVFLGAYTIAGLVEIALGGSLAGAAKTWDNLPSWRKVLISALVIIVVFGAFIGLTVAFA